MIANNVIQFPKPAAAAPSFQQTGEQRALSKLREMAMDPSSPFARRLRELEELHTAGRAARCV